MSAYYEIPLNGQAQTFNITILGTEYLFTTRYLDIPDVGGWFLDIADSAQNIIVSGLALVAGANILSPYAYLDLLGAQTYGTILFLYSDGADPFASPTYSNLGTTCHLLYYIPDPAPVIASGALQVTTGA